MRRKERLITVCSECLKASCWQQVFCCEKFQSAGITRLAESRLRELNREPCDYWLTDEEVAAGIVKRPSSNDGMPGKRSVNPRGLSDTTLRTLIEHVRCPMCLSELDEGWLCSHCGYDVTPIALALLNLPS